MKYLVAICAVLLTTFACEGTPRASGPLDMTCNKVGGLFNTNLYRCENSETVCIATDIGLQCTWKATEK